MFSAPFHGAPSLDALGSYLPPQRFEGVTFHMLTNLGDYGDIAAAVGHEYFIKVMFYTEHLEIIIWNAYYHVVISIAIRVPTFDITKL